MKKSFLNKVVFIAGLLPLTLFAQPYPGDRCEGSVNKEHHTCSIPLEGKDKVAYTYAITVMNVGSKPGYFYSLDSIYSLPYKQGIGSVIAPRSTATIIANSHYCSPEGRMKIGNLVIGGTELGWNTDFVQMQITNVVLIKETPVSALSCGQLKHNYVLMETAG